MSLDSETDKLNELLAKAETAIGEMRMGVCARVPFSGRELSWEKHGSQWMLMVYFDAVQKTPLLKASRELRVSAVEHLDELVVALMKEVARQETEVRDAVLAADAFLARLEAMQRQRTDFKGENGT